MPTTPAPPRSDDPHTIPDLIARLESAFERGCGPLSDEVKRLVDASRRIDGNDGYAAAKALLRARFGPRSEATVVIGGAGPWAWLAILTLLLGLVAIALGGMAWLAWQAAPKIDRIAALNSAPADIEFTVAPSETAAGSIMTVPPTVKVTDRLGSPVPNVKIEFTLESSGAPRPRAYLLPGGADLTLRHKSDDNRTIDFAQGFVPASDFDPAKFKKVKPLSIRWTLESGQASVDRILASVADSAADLGEFVIRARVLNADSPLESRLTVKVVPGPAATLAFETQPQNIAVDSPMPDFSVKATDKFGYPSRVEVAVAVSERPSGVKPEDVKLSTDDGETRIDDNTAVAATNPDTGVATFKGLKIIPKGDGYKLLPALAKGSNGKLRTAPVPSNPFNITP